MSQQLSAIGASMTLAQSHDTEGVIADLAHVGDVGIVIAVADDPLPVLVDLIGRATNNETFLDIGIACANVGLATDKRGSEVMRHVRAWRMANTGSAVGFTGMHPSLAAQMLQRTKAGKSAFPRLLIVDDLHGCMPEREKDFDGAALCDMIGDLQREAREYRAAVLAVVWNCPECVGQPYLSALRRAADFVLELHGDELVIAKSARRPVSRPARSVHKLNLVAVRSGVESEHGDWQTCALVPSRESDPFA